jgi:hypothetical protein
MQDVRWVQDVGTNASGASRLGEALSVKLGIGAWSSIVAAKVVGVVAPEASLHLQVFADAVGWVADQHAKTL